jgi:curved DNA-binding protein CbpA
VAFVKLKEAYEVLSDEQKRTEYDQLRREWARRQGAYLCGSCGTANTVPRRPTPTEQIVCTACNTPLPLDIETAVALQKQRLVAEAARVVDDVGVELATTAIDVAKSGLARLRKRWTGSK